MTGQKTRQKRYVPNVPHLHKVCEYNYVFLLRLLPDCDTEDLRYEFETAGALKFQIQILESSRYTSLIGMTQVVSGSPSYLCPVVEVRLYHDAKMAEVIKVQNMGAIQPSYEYPNLKMHQRNEKEMNNRFLSEWLQFCLTQRTQVLS